MDDLDYALEILKTLGISEVVYRLDGSGDNGTCDLDSVTYNDGRTIHRLPHLTVDFNEYGRIDTLDILLHDLVCNIPDGDWINNAGGQGEIILHPLETDPDLRTDCYMTYHDENESDFDDEDFADDDPDPGNPNADLTDDRQRPVIDDRALAQLSRGAP